MPDNTIPLDEPIGERLNQNGVSPGAKKLAQFVAVMKLRGVSPLYAQEDQGNNAIAYIRLFDPCGSWVTATT